MPNTPPIDLFPCGRVGSGEWIILAVPTLYLGRKPDKLVPDLAGWRRARLPTMPKTAICIAPDWVILISTEPYNRGSKRRIYAREGIAYLWSVNPEKRSLAVYRLVDGHWLVLDRVDGDAKFRAKPFSSRTWVRYPWPQSPVLPSVDNVLQRDVQRADVLLSNDEWFSGSVGFRQADRYPVPRRKPVLTLVKGLINTLPPRSG